jgi:surfactin synthase thioesterase subunit
MTRALVVDHALAETASLRLLVVPHAGGGASAGAELVRYVPEGWCVGTVRFAGRESRFDEEPQGFNEELAEVCAAARAYPGLAPLLLVGACSGAVLAFEAGRALQAESGTVQGVVVMSRQAPEADEAGSPPRPAMTVEELVAMGGVPTDLADDEDLLELVLPALQGDMVAVDGHRVLAAPMLAVPLLVLRGARDRHCSAADVAGWAGFAEVSRQAEVDGGHFLLLDDPGRLVASLEENVEVFLSP